MSGALRRDENKGKVLALFDKFRRAVVCNNREIGAALTCTMQEKHERPALLWAVIFRKVEQIGEGYMDGNVLLQGFCLLMHSWHSFVLFQSSTGYKAIVRKPVWFRPVVSGYNRSDGDATHD